MLLPSSKVVLFNLIKVLTGTQIDPAKYNVLNPVVLPSGGKYNTKVSFQATITGDHYAQQAIRYNRLLLNSFAPIVVRRGSALLISDLLSDIGRVANMSTGIDLSTDPAVKSLVILNLSVDDVVDAPLPVASGTGTTVATLNAHINSLIFTGSVQITLVDNVVLVPGVTDFKSTPAIGKLNDPLVFEGTLENFTPNTFYNVGAYRKTVGGLTPYDGTLIVSFGATTDANGRVTFKEPTYFADLNYDGNSFVTIYPSAIPPQALITPGTFTGLAWSQTNQMKESSTATSIPAINWTVWNPGIVSANVSKNGLTAKGLDPYNAIRSLLSKNTGKSYFELKASNASGVAGVIRLVETLNQYLGYGQYGWGLAGNAYQMRINNNIHTVKTNSWNEASPLGVAINHDTGQIKYLYNNIDIGTVFMGVTGLIHAAASGIVPRFPVDITANFGQIPFENTPPVGFPLGMGSSAFTPFTLPGLLGWYDASDNDTLTITNGKVSVWGDKSGNANHAKQTVDANRYVVSTLSGRQVLSNSGLTSRMDINPVLLPARYNYVIAVLANTAETITLGNSVDSNLHFLQLTAANGGNLVSGRGAQTASIVVGAAATDGLLHRLIQTEHDQTVKLSFDATVSTNAFPRNSVVNQITGGGQTGKYLQGSIAELMFGDWPLSEEWLTSIRGYLNTKWGV